MTDEEKKAHKKEYRAVHKAELQEYMKKYYEDNKTELKVYRAVHKDKIRENGKKYYESHKAKAKAYRKFHQKQKYCCEDISQIENYNLAKKDNFKGWDIHHKLETHNSDGERKLVDLTADELKALDMYYNRPASELIFMKHKEHISLHTKGKKK